MNNLLREYDDIKEKNKDIKALTRLKTMLSYCLKFRKNTEIKNPKLVKINQEIKMLLWKCAACDSKKPKFTKKQEAEGL